MWPALVHDSELGFEALDHIKSTSPLRNQPLPHSYSLRKGKLRTPHMVSITGIYQAYFNAIGRCAEQLGEEIEEVGVAHEDILALLPQLPEQCEEVDVDAVNDRTGEIDL